MAHGPPAAEHVPVVVYATDVWLRGLVEIRGATRLTDVLNHAASPLLALAAGDVLPVGAREWPVLLRPIILTKAEILLAYPTSEAEAVIPAAGLRLPNFTHDVVMHLGAYQVQGTLHLPDAVALAQFFSVVRERFLPLTRATIRRAVDGETVAAASYVVVNRERMKLVYVP